MELTICTGTFGDLAWSDMAWGRARLSAVSQAPWIHVHADTLAEARNQALEQVETEFVAFLDADDLLEPGYVEAMGQGDADLRYPLVRYVRDGEARGAAYPRVVNHHHLCRPECLEAGNFIVIGACARTSLLRDLGGFREFPWCEDWDLWLRCYRAGASIEGSAAIYRAYVTEGRNASLSAPERRRVFAEIAA